MEHLRNIEKVGINKLGDRLQVCSQGKFTGRMNVQEPKGQQWSLYFYLGDLVGDAGGVHPVRRWYRQLSQHCPELGVDAGSIQGENRRRYWDYNSLAALVAQKKIPPERMVAVVEGSILEVLFDILQEERMLPQDSEAQLLYTYLPEDKLNSPSILIPVDQAYQQAQQAWQKWLQAGMVNFSPNWAAVIWQREELQQHTSPIAYKSLTTLLDGKQTLRDLAIKLRQEVSLLTQSLVPYVREVWIGLIEVEDLSQTVEQFTVIQPKQAPVAPPPGRTPQQPTGPLVAYIDDSPMDSQIMSQIIKTANYRYINIQDSVQALPILIEHRPSLIFLDLVMPVANGYEVCAQIRRTSIFKNTPVIIVTGNDGIVDRVRAKLVNSSDFLPKPINTQKVLAMLKKHISVPNQNPT